MCEVSFQDPRDGLMLRSNAIGVANSGITRQSLDKREAQGDYTFHDKVRNEMGIKSYGWRPEPATPAAQAAPAASKPAEPATQSSSQEPQQSEPLNADGIQSSPDRKRQRQRGRSATAALVDGGGGEGMKELFGQ